MCLPVVAQEEVEKEVKEKEWVRVWPCEADGAKSVSDAGGNAFPSTGENACIWFNWGGAGTWKRFKVKKDRPIIIKAQGDSGPGACLGRLDFKLFEIDDGKRTEKFEFDGPTWSGVAPDGEPKYRLIYFVPEAGKFEILCTGGFYVRVYQERDKPKSSELSDDEKSNVKELIKKLACDNWREREEAQKKLMKMDERVLPLLKKHSDSPEIEVRIRLKKIIEALTPMTGEAVSVEAMKREAAEMVEKMGKYIATKKLARDSEPSKNLSLIGPYAVEPLEKLCDDESAHARAAAAQALGGLKAESSVKILAGLLKSDTDWLVRCRAATAMGNFDSEEVVKALKEASENDKDEEVCAAAAEALKAIEKRKSEEK